MSKTILSTITSRRRDLGLVISILCAVVLSPFVFAKGAQNRDKVSPDRESLSSSFEVASITPNQSSAPTASYSFDDPAIFRARNVPVKVLILLAYNIQNAQLSGGPAWIGSRRYDIYAKIPDAVASRERSLTEFQRQALERPMLESLLVERFKLQVIRGEKNFPVYGLVITKGGPKLSRISPAESGNRKRSHAAASASEGTASLVLTGPVPVLADALSRLPEMDRIVVDMTGLRGDYDFSLKWNPPSPSELPAGNTTSVSSSPSTTTGPSVETALQEQLGLRLEPMTRPLGTISIEHIEDASPN